MRKLRSQFVFISLISIALSGCAVRFKGVEAFNAATTPVKYSSSLPEGQKWAGDPYGNGGIARGSGGLQTKTRYGEGANADSLDKVNPKLDQPEKGVGQQAGEYHIDHMNGYGLTNAPISQSTPSDANALSSRNGR
jgi:hypothetical protein